MADVVNAETRSLMMSGIRSSETKLEKAVRLPLFAKGYRYRKNVKSLPGTPDIVLKKYNAVIEVNGCFWHAHECSSFRWPSGEREEWWREKLLKNRERDERKIAALTSAGMRIAIVWGCSLVGNYRLGIGEVSARLSEWLESDSAFLELLELLEKRN